MKHKKTKLEKEKGIVERKKTVGHDPITGKAIRKSFYGSGRHALEQIDEKYHAYMSRGAEISESAETLAAVCEKWAETCKKPVVSDLTYRQTYVYSIDAIKKHFGDALIRDVRQADIQKFFVKNSWRNRWAVDKFYYILKNTFNFAVQNNIIQKSPFIDIRKYSHDSSKKRAYSPDQYFQCVEYAKTHSRGIGAFIVLKSGLRRGELCALRWSDIDFQNKTISVRRAITFKSGKLVISRGKTRNAARIIPVDDETVSFLQSAPRLAPCVVGHVEGQDYIDPKNYAKREYRRFMRDFSTETGNPALSLHELRHTYGTMLYHFHTPLEAIAKVMGHSSLEITRKIYVHDTVDDLKERIVFPAQGIK